MLADSGSGVDKPAAIIVETVQGEGGLNAARRHVAPALSPTCAASTRSYLIVDDVQAGCGRTGTFFSFEQAGIVPDIVCLSKSISGYGLPMALTLIRPDLDVWEPGEHNGTFRGHNPAFVTGRAALEKFWADDIFAKEVRERSTELQCRARRRSRARHGGDRLRSRAARRDPLRRRHASPGRIATAAFRARAAGGDFRPRGRGAQDDAAADHHADPAGRGRRPDRGAAAAEVLQPAA